MNQLRWLIAGATMTALGFAIGNWTARDATVHAEGDIQFQLHEVGPSNSLSIYSPSNNSIYVYQGAFSGNSSLQCSYRFQLGAAGGVIRRQNCDVHSLNP
jgi:hypothetical protein